MTDMVPQRRGRDTDPGRERLAARRKITTIAILLRNLQAFEQARVLLTPRVVREAIGVPYGIVWEEAIVFNDEVGRMPDLPHLLSALPDEESGKLEVEEIAEARAFLERAFDPIELPRRVAESDKSRKYALTTIRLVLQEHSAGRVARLLESDLLPSRLAEILRDAAVKVEEADALADDSLVDEVVFEDGWDLRPQPQLVPTRIAAIDYLLCGGQAAGEVYVFMAPIGAGKSTTAIAAVVEMAGYAVELAGLVPHPDGLLPVAVMVSAEMQRPEFQTRVLMTAATIPRDRIRLIGQGGRGLEVLAAVEPQVYERRVFHASLQTGEGFIPERQRAQAGVELINRHVLFVDFTPGNAASPTAGAGGIPELVSTLKRRLEKRKAYPVAVWIDHADAIADRMVELGKLEEAERTGILKRMVKQCRDHVAVPLNCPVWLLHQFSGVVNERGPTAKLHHTHAAGCKMFGAYSDAAIVMTMPDDDQLCRMDNTKRRRTPPRASRLIRMEGDLGRLHDVSEHYQISSSGEIENIRDGQVLGHGNNRTGRTAGGGSVVHRSPEQLPGTHRPGGF